MRRELSAERVRHLLSYDQETGVLSWRFARRGISAGPAGAIAKNGYVYVCVDGGHYLAHRLAWLYVTGSWPDGVIDHRNGVRTDNRWSNLRDVSVAVNAQHRVGVRTNNTSGVIGVSWYARSQKWRARIWANGRLHLLGLFSDLAEAEKAYLSARSALHHEAIT
jgi:hypothetical protein